MAYNLMTDAAWIPDVIFLVLLFIFVMVGAGRGFVKSVTKLAGTLFAVAFAIFFCISFEGFLESIFGMTSAIADGIVGSLSSNEFMAVELSGPATEEALAKVMDPFYAKILSTVLAGQNFPEGATGATLLGPIFAKWIAIAISFIALIILIKLAIMLISGILSDSIEKITPLRITDRFLGALMGFLKGGLGVFLILAICSWLPIQPLHDFLTNSSIIGVIYRSDWFISATNYIASFQWLNDYIVNFNPT